MFLVDMFNNGELYKVSIYGESKEKITDYLYGISQEVIFLRQDDETETQKKKRLNQRLREIHVNGEWIGTFCKCEFRTDRCQSLDRSKKLEGIDPRHTKWGEYDE